MKPIHPFRAAPLLALFGALLASAPLPAAAQAPAAEPAGQYAVGDRRLVQYITALRCFLPRAGISCSSRESAFMRDRLVPLGVTRVSAGVSTAVGGRATEDLHNPGQFEISDHRSLEQMAAALAANGYQAVLKDWETPVEAATA